MQTPGNRRTSKKTERGASGGGDGRRAARRTRTIDPAVAQWLAGAEASFPRSRSATIPMLQSAQAALGYLSDDAMHVIARHVGAPAALVAGVASFYAQFRFQKPGRHRVTICRGTACHVRGSGELMHDMEADLKVAAGGTTADGKVTLEAVSCFGACALAPVAVIDGKVNGRVNAAALKKLVDAADKPARRARGARSEM